MNSRYRFANERFLTGQLDWLSDAFKVLLVDKTYTVQTDVHHTLADVPVSARVAASPALTGKSATDGVARADDVTVNTVQGQEVFALVIYHASDSESDSELVAYIDTANGLPYLPQGTTMVVHWDTGPAGIFSL
jgi:hypothetical protein